MRRRRILPAPAHSTLASRHELGWLIIAVVLALLASLWLVEPIAGKYF